MTIRPAMTALVVAMAGMMLPAIAVYRNVEWGRGKKREKGRKREGGGEGRERERLKI